MVGRIRNRIFCLQRHALAEVGAEGNSRANGWLRSVFPLISTAWASTTCRERNSTKNICPISQKHPLYLPGAEEFLSALRKAGRIYIVTNGSEKIQKSRFRIAKLETYAEAVFISETIGCDKPGKAYNDYVIAHIPGFDRARTVWIGDSLTADVKAANEAGIDCIWFNPHDKSTDGKAFPDYEADCYREILEILQID